MLVSSKDRKNKLIYLLVFLVISQAMIFILTPILIFYIFQSPGFTTELFAIIMSFILPILIILIISAKKNEFDEAFLLFAIDNLYKRPIKKYSISLSFSMGFLLSIIVMYVINFVEIVYILITGNYWIISILPPLNILTILFSIVLFAMLPAIFEELLYRGMYYDTFRSSNKFLRYFIPLIMFVLAHSGVFSAFSALVLGTVLIYLMIKGTSIIVCTLIHFAFNLAAIIFTNIISLPFSPLRLLIAYASERQMIGVLFIYSSIILLLGTILFSFLKFVIISPDHVILEQRAEDIRKFSIVEIMLIIMMIIVSLFSFLIRIM